MNKYYTVEKISELLNMHPKTIRKYIREGKLRANKVGKEWRITGHDLSAFAEGKGSSFINTPNPINSNRKIKKKPTVSAVIDIDVFDMEEGIKIVNTLTAALNIKPIEYGQSTMNSQFIEQESKVRVMLWGTIPFMEDILAAINVVSQQS